MKKTTLLLSALALLPLLAGCQALTALSSLGSQYGITGQRVQSAAKVAKSVAKSFESLTPEQEYYLGRAVSASILKQYRPYDRKDLNRYLNLVGQSLAGVSDKPETFGGYHFLAIDSDEINAFAAPGGFILVSRGLIKCCRNEDALAAVLAHEIGHIQCAHGVKAIKSSRWTDTITTVGTEAAKNFGPSQVAELTTAFEGSISDITGTLVNSGYSRKSEYEADRTAIQIMQRLGYDPNALKAMLKEMESRVKPETGFGKTHPSPANRIKEIGSLPENASKAGGLDRRTARFDKAVAGI